MSSLFTPLTIKGVRVENRVVLPPIATPNWSDEGGLVSDRNVAHYERIAAAGCGLIIVEATSVMEAGRLRSTQLGIWSDAHVEGMARLVRACHGHGAKVLLQLFHGGFKTSREVTPDPVAPSDYRNGQWQARALTPEEIRGIERDFTAAARRAAEAGLDGVELHGAHGFLLNQFASPDVNRREDAYGGDLSGRLKLASDIITCIRDGAAGDEFLIAYRMGCNEPDLEHGIAIARALEAAGVDLLDVSAGFGRPLRVPPDFPFSWTLHGGMAIRRHVSVPVIVVGGILDGTTAEAVMEDGADLVAVGKAQLADPQWAGKVARGEEVVRCCGCKPQCHWFTDETECPRFVPLPGLG